ncbi:hypothetical protein BpHYR1_036834 [Brachionus plicatilis]|uniref:Senescence domain-containing protein n=1 Tax=Brachionus plicatilis TaxID=10195 RepID=A0A3M7RGK3_BRAPC|nr:hypothetical protein BpHYR1_036834 [Brachionus plicatilis]
MSFFILADNGEVLISFFLRKDSDLTQIQRQLILNKKMHTQIQCLLVFEVIRLHVIFHFHCKMLPNFTKNCVILLKLAYYLMHSIHLLIPEFSNNLHTFFKRKIDLNEKLTRKIIDTVLRMHPSKSIIQKLCYVQTEIFICCLNNYCAVNKSLDESKLFSKILIIYGPEAAKVTENGLYSVGNAATTVYNFRNMKIVRTVAKETAKETLSSSSKINKTSESSELRKNNNENNKKANKTSTFNKISVYFVLVIAKFFPNIHQFLINLNVANTANNR